MKRRIEDIDFEKHFDTINHKLNLLLKEKNNPKKTWVSASIISDLTGWNDHYLLKARRNNVVESRKKGSRFEYCIESIPEIFLLKKN